jgi:hypothetical protein
VSGERGKSALNRAGPASESGSKCCPSLSEARRVRPHHRVPKDGQGTLLRDRRSVLGCYPTPFKGNPLPPSPYGCQAGLIDFLTMWPDARRRVVPLGTGCLGTQTLGVRIPLGPR